MGTVLGLHLVASMHTTHRGLEKRSAGVLEALAGLDVRLLANYTFAPHFLNLAVCVRQDLMTVEQSGRRDPCVLNAHSVCEHVTVGIRLRLFRKVFTDNGNFYLETGVAGLVHHVQCPENAPLCVAGAGLVIGAPVSGNIGSSVVLSAVVW